MDILMTYLQNDKPLTMKRIVLTLWGMALFIALLSLGISYTVITQPEVDQFLTTLPTIEMKDGVVVAPADTLTELDGPNRQIKFILNTKIDDLQNPPDNTIVLTKNALYTTFKNQTQKIALPTESITITRAFLAKMFRAGLIELAVFILLLSGIVLSIGYYGTYWLTYLLLKVCQKTREKDTIKKAGFIGWISIVILNTVLVMAGYGFSALNAMFLASFIALFCLFQIKD